ncbi:hypothetical protein OG302_22260 [Streptomyces sp. NBC_01283]|uniref:hypothetical protein n=1 Tax=Streptomyces sp. NBC_01283 TaxID=2903812 RepID=UPI00352D24E7|nr:hypothetical protein OG302_22260 [Streptomyces sp. NBC_01283]
MTVQICSLKTETPQAITPGSYQVVRFPYADESIDVHGMHNQVDPLNYETRDWQRSDRSGLIWPSMDGWGCLTSLIYWEAGDYDELRDRYVRDPLDLSTGADSTATEHRPPSPGQQFFHKSHEMFVRVGTPIALLVAQDAPRTTRLTLAEFKLAIHPA